MLNNFNEDQIVDTDNTTKKQFTQFGPNNNIFLESTTAASDTPEETARWDFNDGSGTTITAAVGGNNITAVGTSGTWGTGYFQTNNGQWTAPVGFLSQIDNYSFFLWTSLNDASQTTTRYYLSLGSGGTNSALAFTLYIGATGKVNCAIIDGSSQTVISIPATSFLPASNEKFLICFTYTRVGGATNNAMSVRVTKDGTNWFEASNTSARLMRKLSTFFWRAGTGGSSSRYYRFGIYNNKVLSNSEMQAIWDVGSEGTPIQYRVALNASSERPSTLFINNGIYSNTSNINAGITGVNGTKDIFAVAQSNGTFTLSVVDRNTAAPSNSRYIGTGTLASGSFTINRSLSSQVEKEVKSITSTTSTVTLNTLSINQGDSIFVYVNGMFQDSTNYTTTSNQVNFSPAELNTGDQVVVVKIKNSATFIRPS